MDSNKNEAKTYLNRRPQDSHSLKAEKFSNLHLDENFLRVKPNM